MPEEFQAANFMVRYIDVVNISHFYNMMHFYLMEEGFQDRNGDINHKFIETYFMERNLTKSFNKGGKEYWIYWRAQKFPEGKYSKFYRWILDIDYHFMNVQDQEILHEGKKVVAQNGTFEINVRAKVQADYLDRWKNHKFLQGFRDVFIHRVVQSDIRRQKKQLWREAYRFQAFMKNIFNIRQMHPTSAEFMPKKLGVE